MFRSGKHARTRTGSIYRRPAVAILIAFMTLTASVALADNLQSDLDTTTGGETKTIDRGTLSPSTGYTQDVFLFVQDTPGGLQPSYPFSVIGSGNLGATFSGVTMSGPGTLNGQTGQVSWTTPAAQAAAQNYEITVTFDANTTINESPATVTIRFAIAGTPSDTTAPQNATITINDGADWTNDSGGNVTVDISATDNVGVASYRLAETQAGLAAATPVPVNPAEASFSRTNVGFTLTGAEGASKSVWLRVCDGASVPNCADASDAIGWDKTAPTVEYTSASPAANGAGWNNTDVVATFTATDNVSGFAPGVGTPPIGALTTTGTATTSGEGTSVTVGSPAFTDVAGNTVAAESATSAAFKIDKTAPTNIAFVGGGITEGAEYYFGFVPAGPDATCTADGAISGLASCNVTGGGTTVGVHSYVATATDNAGNSDTATLSYTVLAWTLIGFYQPVDMPDVWNTVKGGSTVPFKFNIFAGTTELTNTTSVTGFTAKAVLCPAASMAGDPIEVLATGGTSLRYDTTGGQFVYNWQTPKKPGTCYEITMTTLDGSTLMANFKLK